MITLPTDFIANIGDSASGFLGTLSPIVTLVLGVLLAAVVIEIIIGSMRHK